MNFLLIALYSITISLIFLTGCQLQGKEPSDPDIKDITSRDLYRQLRSQKRILLVDAWQDLAYRDSVRQLVNEFYREDWELVVRDHDEVSEEEMYSTPTLLIGAPDQNRWIPRFIEKLPFSVDKHQIGMAAFEFNAESHSLALSYYPNPLNVKMPIGMFVSQNESLVWELVKSRITSFFRTSWHYEIATDRQRILLGNFSQSPKDRWEFDAKQQIELPSDAVVQWKSGAFSFKGYHQNLDQASMHALVSTCQQELSQIEQLVGREWEGSPINYFMYPSTEIKGLMTGNTDQSHISLGQSAVHTAFDPHFQDRYYGKETRLILRQFLGEPTFEILEIGLSVMYSRTWQKQGHLYWAKHIIEADNSIILSQLLDPNQSPYYSTLMVEALAASFTEYLLSYWGKEEFLKQYKSWKPQSDELEALNDQWRTWLKARGNKMDFTVDQVELPHLKGFNFTHEGYQIYNGYGSVLSAKSMQRVKQLGANAVAVVPYSWMRDPGIPTILRFSDRAGSENDEGVIHTISQAKQNGMITLLKPHVWISGGWPGEVEMKSESDWDLFFDQYYQWISHYALLAEMYDVEALCIGVEFSKATLAKEYKWRALIGKIRALYSGQLTYAANWGEEFENIRFWDQLDFIGLNCYYPLSIKQKVKGNDLVEGFSEILKKVHTVKSRFGKPVVLTEIGFRSIESPWLQPHAESGQAAFNEVHQAMCYDAVFKAVSRYPVVDGILWWKWPTNLEVQFENDRRFVPSGKKAEQVIERWF
jgi:hypothetical protein